MLTRRREERRGRARVETVKALNAAEPYSGVPSIDEEPLVESETGREASNLRSKAHDHGKPGGVICSFRVFPIVSELAHEIQNINV